MYDKKSLKAEEFINDGEILDTLKYADENKDNLALIDKIIDKARLRKGLDHREASVLLACEDSERIAKIYDLAEQIKKDFYGDRSSFCTFISFKLLCKRLCLLPVSS